MMTMVILIIRKMDCTEKLKLSPTDSAYGSFGHERESPEMHGSSPVHGVTLPAPVTHAAPPATSAASREIAYQYEEIFRKDLTIDKKGGVFDFSDIGVKIDVPAGAVDDVSNLFVSVCDAFSTPPDTKERNTGWVPVAPMVKIEPHTEFKKPVTMSVDHNLDLRNEATKHMVAFHRDNEYADWRVIPTSGTKIAEEETFGFQFCRDKTVCYREKTIVFEMYSSCLLYAYYNHLDVKMRCFRMSVMVYADYQSAAQKINVRVHLTVDTRDRKQLVEGEESKRRSHSLGCDTLRLENDTKCVPLKVSMGLEQDAQPIPVQDETFTGEEVSGELSSRSGHVLYRSFHVRINPDCGYVDVKVTVTNGTGDIQSTATVRDVKDLCQLTQSRPQ